MQSHNYTLEDLIIDPAFIRWVKDPENISIDWLKFASSSKENCLIVAQARTFVNFFLKDIDAPGWQDMEEVWKRIEATNTGLELN